MREDSVEAIKAIFFISANFIYDLLKVFSMPMELAKIRYCDKTSKGSKII